MASRGRCVWRNWMSCSDFVSVCRRVACCNEVSCRSHRKLGRSNDSDAHTASGEEGRWARRAMTRVTSLGECRDLFCWIFGKDSTAGSAGGPPNKWERACQERRRVVYTLTRSGIAPRVPDAFDGAKSGRGGIIEVGRNKGVPVGWSLSDFSLASCSGQAHLNSTKGVTHKSHMCLSSSVLACCCLKLAEEGRNSVCWNADTPKGATTSRLYAGSRDTQPLFCLKSRGTMTEY